MTIHAAIVPGAGRSERFGSMKLLADVRGEPLLNHTLRSLIDAGASAIVVVLAPHADLAAVTLLDHAAVRTIVNANPSRGMFSSIQCGLAAAGAGPTVVLPADMPFVAAATVSLVADTSARTDRVVVPTYQGQRGHPIALPGRLRDGLLMMDPTHSLKDGLGVLGEELLLIDVSDPGVVRDVDVKEDLNRGIDDC